MSDPVVDEPVVHLVGTGPGDPWLLTRRARDLLARADVVVADRRSSDAVLALAPAAAERHLVGRADGADAWPLDRVVELLAERAARGGTVVRCKSGDPFVCSRGAEEVEALAARGVRCHVVPGVTAATAAPLLAGAPRGRSVTIASGDHDPLGAPVAWEELADGAGSLVVLTGRAHQGRIAARLQAGGLPDATPVTVVHGASRPGQRQLLTSLAELGSVRLPPPAAFVVGPIPGSDRAHP